MTPEYTHPDPTTTKPELITGLPDWNTPAEVTDPVAAESTYDPNDMMGENGTVALHTIEMSDGSRLPMRKVAEKLDPTSGEAVSTFETYKNDELVREERTQSELADFLKRFEAERAPLSPAQQDLAKAALRPVPAIEFYQADPDEYISREALAALQAKAVESAPTADTERLQSELATLTEGLSESDKSALWQYGGAITETELSNSKNKMSDQAKRILGQYTRIYDALKQARRAE